MGIVAGEVQKGDEILWIPEVEKAVIVQRDNTLPERMGIIGTVVVPKKFWKRSWQGTAPNISNPVKSLS
jgi:hypothetical protein